MQWTLLIPHLDPFCRPLRTLVSTAHCSPSPESHLKQNRSHLTQITNCPPLSPKHSGRLQVQKVELQVGPKFGAICAAQVPIGQDCRQISVKTTFLLCFLSLACLASFSPLLLRIGDPERSGHHLYESSNSDTLLESPT